jgi:hypothetical protein
MTGSFLKDLPEVLMNTSVSLIHLRGGVRAEGGKGVELC